MKSELEKLKKELLNWSDYHTDIEILEMNREKYEKVFNYFKKANFKIRYFLERSSREDEVKPKVLLPIGPEDRSWNKANISGNGLKFLMVFYGEYDDMFLDFLAEEISSVKKARSLAKLMKDLANLLDETVTINGGHSDTVIVECIPEDECLRLYHEPELFYVRSSFSKKSRAS